jgi:S-adenosylmethionine hydrolase
LVRLDLKSASVDDKGLTGEVIALDGPFGNLVTNVSAPRIL